MGGAVPPLPNTPSWRGAQLGGAQRQLYLCGKEFYKLILIGLYFYGYHNTKPACNGIPKPWTIAVLLNTRTSRQK
jgi:hypothetical protein